MFYSQRAFMTLLIIFCGNASSVNNSFSRFVKTAANTLPFQTISTPNIVIGNTTLPERPARKSAPHKPTKRKFKQTPLSTEYNREYKKRFAWIRYRKITQEAFYAWSKEAQAMRDKALAGQITFKEFKVWLNE